MVAEFTSFMIAKAFLVKVLSTLSALAFLTMLVLKSAVLSKSIEVSKLGISPLIKSESREIDSVMPSSAI